MINDEENFITPKNKREGEEVRINRKMAKNKQRKERKNRNEIEELEAYCEKKNEDSSKETRINDIVTRLHEIFILESTTTIREVLKKCNNDENKASETLSEKLYNEQSEPEKIKIETTKLIEEPAIEVIANKLLEDVQENEEKELTGLEFEELFEEITEAIRAVSRENECPQNFMEDVLESRRILIGESDEFEVDEHDPLKTELEKFMLKLYSEKHKENEKNKIHFPALKASSNENFYKEYEEKTWEDFSETFKGKKKQLDYNELQEKGMFIPTNKPVREKRIAPNIFEIENIKGSLKSMELLHKEFPGFELYRLRYLFGEIQDFLVCRSFLEEYYPDRRERSYVRKTKQKNRPRTIDLEVESKEEYVEAGLEALGYEEIRNRIDRLFKLRQAYKLTRANITNNKSRNYLEAKANENEPLLEKMKKASRVLLIRKIVATNPFSEVDLHGYREEEIGPLMNDLVEMVQSEYCRGKIALKNAKECMLTLIPGIGKGSKGRISVLKPALHQWAEHTPHRIITSPGEGEATLYIRLK